MPAPDWLGLFAPLPGDAVVVRKPVASPQQIAAGTAGPIAGWQNVTVYLSEPALGVRHVQVTLDANGVLLAGNDHVMFIRHSAPDGSATLTDHESVGGRFETDGSFRGTHWKATLEGGGDEETSVTRSAEHREPTPAEVEALRRLIDALLRREITS
jgi:hypothetical protein